MPPKGACLNPVVKGVSDNGRRLGNQQGNYLTPGKKGVGPHGLTCCALDSGRLSTTERVWVGKACFAGLRYSLLPGETQPALKQGGDLRCQQEMAG